MLKVEILATTSLLYTVCSILRLHVSCVRRDSVLLLKLQVAAVCVLTFSLCPEACSLPVSTALCCGAVGCTADSIRT